MSILADVSAAAEVQVVLASRLARLGAIVVDILISLGGQSLVRLLGPLFAVLLLAVAAVQIVLVSKRGQTIGKWLIGVAIVDLIDKQPPGFVKAALIRTLPQMVLNVFFPTIAVVYLVADALPIFRANRRCIHDYLAGTIVIKTAPLAP